MGLDGGGWTLTWKHSYMEVGALSGDMKYYSSHYQACTDLNTGWCNVPRKIRLNPTEMAIAAYHNKRLVYAYKGIYNANLDRHWSGGMLLDPTQLVDHCTVDKSNGVEPAPFITSQLGGIAFDKLSPLDYNGNCDTLRGSLNNPGDCRLENCKLPSSISSNQQHTQMTVAIYVR